jgi:hypothetical protein
MANKKSTAKTPQQRAEQLARRLTDAICGWLTFQQAANRHRTYNEHLIYLPIFEVADGRKWEVHPQFPFLDPASGRYRWVDFLFFSEKYSVFALLEIKLQKSRGTEIGIMSRDVKKMTRVTHSMIAEALPGLQKPCNAAIPIHRLMMCVGQGSSGQKSPKKLWRRNGEERQLRDQAAKLFKDSGKYHAQSSLDVGCLRISPADFTSTDWRVITLYEQSWWTELEAVPSEEAKSNDLKAKS